jgi:hypothetical protein
MICKIARTSTEARNAKPCPQATKVGGSWAIEVKNLEHLAELVREWDANIVISVAAGSGRMKLEIFDQFPEE